MTVADEYTLKIIPRIGRRHEAVRYEVMEMHLFDAEATEEKPLCGEDSSPVEQMSVDYYLEELLCGLPVGTVCDKCKALAMPLVEAIIEDMAGDLEDEGRLGDAEDCRELLNTLAREMGMDRRPD